MRFNIHFRATDNAKGSGAERRRKSVFAFVHHANTAGGRHATADARYATADARYATEDTRNEATMA